ncbi:MAG: hypothetical protein AB7P16_28505 [Bradyrhizobium sp.]|uniref:hypothetical protein n=1 Tax=Bradyrhizobium sp. TaxID=376 RepID=UPI003D12FBD4
MAKRASAAAAATDDETNHTPAPRVERRSYSPREIAERNGFSVPFVYKQIRTGALRAFRVGDSVAGLRVLAEDEEPWLMGICDVQGAPRVGLSKERSAELSARRKGKAHGWRNEERAA